jgi:hypothetical protein
MTVTPVSGRTRVRHLRLSGWAVVTAAVAAVLVAVGLTTLGIVGFDADDEDFDNWKGVVVSIGLFGGVVVSVTAFALAVVAKVRHERWVLLWFPLLFAPVLIFSFPLWFE